MFGKSSKEQYVQSATTPIAVSGSNSSPFMQEMLKGEENRRQKQTEEAYNRRQGYIK